ncbi:MFS transporter [Kitasatospora sp. NPDC058048]|uniref:MFS transporter n=1 Tax=Kitasatospora sp. NPDC058048 TaxID=3346313 RepID=UPI0036D98530
MQTPAPDGSGHPRRWWILGVLSLALFTTVLNNGLLNVAVPGLVRDLGIDLGRTQWIVDAYALTFAALLLTAGALSDRYGRKRATLLGAALFGGASLLAPAADGPAQLVAARAAMGLGAAFMMPGTLSILNQVFPARERPRAIAVWGSVSALGVAVGPVLGGLLVSHFWWGSVFLVNLAPVLVTLLAGAVLLPESAAPVPRPADPVGALLGAGAMAALVYGVIQASGHGWTARPVVAALALAAGAAAAFVAWERRHPSPVVDFELLRDRNFLGASAGNMLLFLGIAGTLFVLTQRLQLEFGYSALRAGAAVVPLALAVGVGSAFAPAVARRGGPRGGVAGGLALAAGGILCLGQASGSYPPVLLGCVLIGVGGGLALTPATDTVIGLVPAERSGSAAALNDTLQELGNALGVAVVGTALARGYADGTAALPEEAGRSLGGAVEYAGRQGPEAGSAVVAVAEHAFAGAAATALGVAAAVVAAGAVLSWVLLPGAAGRGTAGRRRRVPSVAADD